MKRYLSTVVAVSIMLVVQPARSLELMISNGTGGALLATPLTSHGDRVDKVSLAPGKPVVQSSSLTKSMLQDRLRDYPSGTVALVFRDANHQFKGLFPLLAQIERRVGGYPKTLEKEFEPTVRLVDIPERFVMQFEITEVWQKSTDSEVEFVTYLEAAH